MADRASYRDTTLLVSLVPTLDFLTTEGSIQGTSEISSLGASWGAFIRIFITSIFAMGFVIGSLITALVTQAFTLGLINHRGF